MVETRDRLALYLVREQFGCVVGCVAQVLLRQGALTLRSIIGFTTHGVSDCVKLHAEVDDTEISTDHATPQQTREALVVLLNHHIASVKEGMGPPVYTVAAEDVLMRLRLPSLLACVQSRLGICAELILEEVIVLGTASASQISEALANKLQAEESIAEEFEPDITKDMLATGGEVLFSALQRLVNDNLLDMERIHGVARTRHAGAKSGSDHYVRIEDAGDEEEFVFGVDKATTQNALAPEGGKRKIDHTAAAVGSSRKRPRHQNGVPSTAPSSSSSSASAAASYRRRAEGVVVFWRPNFALMLRQEIIGLTQQFFTEMFHGEKDVGMICAAMLSDKNDPEFVAAGGNGGGAGSSTGEHEENAILRAAIFDDSDFMGPTHSTYALFQYICCL